MGTAKTYAEPQPKTAPATHTQQPALPEKQAGPLRSASIQRAATPPPPDEAAARLADPAMGAAQRARAMRAMQGSIGSARVSRMLGAPLQPQLTVGAPDDTYEREAEQVADQVMRAPEPAPRAPTRVSRRQIQAQAASGAEQPVSPAVEAHVNASRDGGQPLSDSVRANMEPRFGQDFSAVRVHTSPDSARATQDLSARAFTSGRDIHFAEGQYQPGTPAGDKLLAHELTHVVQQGGAENGPVARAPETPALRASPPAGGAAGAPPPAQGDDVAPGMLDLKEMSTAFKPPEPIASFLEGRKQATVNARWGSLAQGPIQIKRTGKDRYTIKPQALPLRSPLFARVAATAPDLQPALIIRTRGGKLDGFAGLQAAAKIPETPGALAAAISKAPALLGLAGFDFKGTPRLTNTIEDGSLHVGLKGVKAKLGSAFDATIDLEAIDETVTFTGSANVQVKGLASGTLDLQRAPDGLVTGKVAVALTLPKNFSGNVDVAWDGVAITGEGKVGYQGEKLSGEVILRLTEKDEATRLEQQKKAPSQEGGPGQAPAAGPAKAEAPPAKKRKGNIDYVVFGEGDLTFAFTDWLNGSAHVIVDQKGAVTIIGKITPQKEFTLFEQRDYIKPLPKLEARAAYGIPVVGNIFIFANIGLDAFAKLGPAKFYNIVVEGTYSTDPEKNKDFSIRGSLNVSAAAGLRLRAEAGAGLEVLDHDIKAGAGVNGIAGIRGYAEATPIIGYREQASQGEDKKGEFFIRGELEIAAQPFLGLGGDLFVELDSPWWSPAPDKKWTWPLGNKEWPIGGSFGVKASVDYVFGSNQLPALEFQPVDFSADKFMTDLYHDKAPPKSGEGKDQKGEWKEKNSAEATPPTGEAKGDAKPGAAPEQPAGAGKGAATGATAAQGDKKATPESRTAEGKSVKELQEEAAKKGKKPEGKEPTTGAKEEPTEKGKDTDTDKPKDTTAAIQRVKTALDTHLPKGAQHLADVDKVLADVAPKVQPTLTRLHAEEVMPGKPKNEGAIGFKVKAQGEKGDVLIAAVRYSQSGGALSHEERWQAGVKGVKRGVAQLEKRGISEETIREQLPRWQQEFGFTSLTLDTKKTPWVIEGEMSPGKEVTTINVGPRQTRIGYHGTVGDSILSIVGRGEMVPQGGEIYIGTNRSELFSYGADTTRKAAFVIKIELSFDPAKVTQATTSRPGAPKSTIVLQTSEPVLARVLEMYVRKPTTKEEREEGAGAFIESTIIGESNTRAYLSGGALEKSGTQSHEERWQAGVKGVKRAVAELEQRGISAEAVRAELPKWQAEFGFTSLTLNTQKTPWVIEGEMSPGKEVTTVGGTSSKKRPDHSALLQDLQEGKDKGINGLDSLISEIARLSPHEAASEALVERVQKALAQKPVEEKTTYQLIAEHAWEQHRHDLIRCGAKDIETAAELIQGVLGGRYDKTKKGARGRTLYWVGRYRLFVVYDPNSEHQGTAYIPDFTGLSDEEWWRQQE